MDSAVRNLLKLQEMDRKLESTNKKPTESQVQKRKELAESLPSYVESTYEKIRGTRRNPAVVALVDGYCQACQMQVPPYLAQRVQYDHEIEVCEHCGRLLFAGEMAELTITAA